MSLALALRGGAAATLIALGAGPPAPPYVHVATLPSIVDGQAMRAFTYDPVRHRLYAGSDRGLFWADLAHPQPRLTGPVVRKDIVRLEMAPDLGRVFYIADDEVGYVDLRAPGVSVRLAPRNQAFDLAYEPSRRELYVAVRAPHVLVFDAASGERAADVRVPGWWAQDLEAIPGRVFLTVGGKQGLHAIEAGTHRLAPWPIAQGITTPAHADADPSGAHLFLVNEREIVAVDAATATVVGRVTTPFPAAIAYDADTGLLLASWSPDPPPVQVVAYRIGRRGLEEVARLTNPDLGRAGLESTRGGFIQSGWRSLLIWKAQ